MTSLKVERVTYRGRSLSLKLCMSVIILSVLGALVEIPAAQYIANWWDEMTGVNLCRAAEQLDLSLESNLALRGIILGISFNVRETTSSGSHVFSAEIALNVTRVLWVKNIGSNWHNQSYVIVGYDNEEVSELRVLTADLLVEARGYWWQTIGSVYSFKLIVAPCVSDSRVFYNQTYYG